MGSKKLSLEEWTPIMLALVGAGGIFPFAVYRAITGNYVTAIVDLLAVCAFAGLAWAVYAKGAVRAGSICMAFVAIATCVATSLIKGGFQVLWIFPSTVAVFFLLRPREAGVVSLVSIGVVTPVILDLPTAEVRAVFVASLIVTLTLSVMFAALTAKRRNEVTEMAFLDPLTGIGNRRAFNKFASAAVDNAPCSGGVLALIMADVDHFKSINDTYGHAVGDLVITAIAQCFREELRSKDQCFRTGGEEFVVVTNVDNVAEARSLAERLRVRVMELKTRCDHAGVIVPATASFGVAEFRSGESLDALYTRVDDALYGAKRSGRNAVYVAKEKGAPSASNVSRLQSR